MQRFMILGMICFAFQAKSFAQEQKLSLINPTSSTNPKSLGLKIGSVSGQIGASFGIHFDSQNSVEAAYLKDDDSQRKGSHESESESFSLVYRRFLSPSFYMAGGLGINEYRAVMNNANLEDFHVSVMNRDLSLHLAVGNRWKLDDVWFIGCEWVAFDKSLAELDRESSIASLTGGRANRAQAEVFAMKSLNSFPFESLTFLNLEFGLFF